MRLAAFILFWLPVVAFGQPEAVIVGPERGEPGNLVILRTTGSQGTGHTWKVLPPEAEAQFLPILDAQGNHAAVFASSREGRFHFVLAVAQDGEAAVAIHTLVQGEPDDPDEPDPDPDPDPDPPPPDDTLADLVEQWADEIDDREGALRLSAAYQGTIQFIDSGNITSVEQVLGTEDRPGLQALANTAVMGNKLTAWRPFLDKLGAHLGELEINDLRTLRSLWSEIVEGLQR